MTHRHTGGERSEGTTHTDVIRRGSGGEDATGESATCRER